MRAGITGLPTPHGLMATLPGIYQGQPFLERWCAALDEVLAPVLCTLDNIPSYLDVTTTPDDFLPYLAYWIGLPLGPHQPPEAQRRVVKAATTEQGWQGTRRGLALVVEAVFGGTVTVVDTGGVSWSQEPGAGLPDGADDASPSLVVRVEVPDTSAVDERRLEALVARLKPAHVSHRIEVRSAA